MSREEKGREKEKKGVKWKGKGRKAEERMEKRKKGDKRTRREDKGGMSSIFMVVSSLLPAGETCQTISLWCQGHKTPSPLSAWSS